LRKGFGAHHRPGSPAIGTKLRTTLVDPIDERLRHNALVLGVLANGAAAAFPLEQLRQSGAVLHATVGDEDIVVFHRPGTLHTLAYSAVLDGERVEFEVGALGRVVDTRTGSHWSYAGECADGPLRGKKLRYVNSGIVEWYVWAAQHPSTTIFFADPDAAVRRDGRPAGRGEPGKQS